MFKCNNYPVNIIHQCIKNFLDKLYVSKQIVPVPTVLKREWLVVLPFLGEFSLNLRIRLYKSVSKSLPQCNVKIIFQSKDRLSSLFKFKDSIPLYLRYHLIHKFQCYLQIAILLTMAKLNVILKLELVKIKYVSINNKRVNNNKKSSVKDHCFLSGHVCSFDDFTVLNYESHKFKRFIK